MADDKPLEVAHEAPPGKHYMIIAKNTDGRPCGWGKAKSYEDARRVADEQFAKHGYDGKGCYDGEQKGNYDVSLVDEAPVSHELYCRMTDQALAIVTFAEKNFIDPTKESKFDDNLDDDDDRDMLERAADHVAVLNGYESCSTVSDAIWRMLKKRLNVPEKYERSLVE